MSTPDRTFGWGAYNSDLQGTQKRSGAPNKVVTLNFSCAFETCAVNAFAAWMWRTLRQHFFGPIFDSMGMAQ